MKTEKPRECEVCNKPLRGRIDKRFCDDFCRNIYHNNKSPDGKTTIKKINKTLVRNRTVLSSFFNTDELLIRITREELLDKGFVFRYYTHTKKNKNGSNFHYCYDYGYLELENEMYLLIKEG